MSLRLSDVSDVANVTARKTLKMPGVVPQTNAARKRAVSARSLDPAEEVLVGKGAAPKLYLKRQIFGVLDIVEDVLTELPSRTHVQATQRFPP